jgi:hypothetical protein
MSGRPVSVRTTPPFRADHVGSFLRPAKLREARKQRAAGAISAGELRAVEDEAVREVVALQREAGLRSVTDGEFRRATWHMDFIYQIGGISKAPGSLVSTFHNDQGDIAFTPDAIAVTRKLSMDRCPLTSNIPLCQLTLLDWGLLSLQFPHDVTWGTERDLWGWARRRRGPGTPIRSSSCVISTRTAASTASCRLHGRGCALRRSCRPGSSAGPGARSICLACGGR